MAEVVQTSPTTLRLVRNLRGTAPDLVSSTFLFKTNSYVFKNPEGQFEYYSVGPISKRVKETQGKFVTLLKRPPVIENGLILLAGRVAVVVSSDDIIRGRVNKTLTLTNQGLREFVYGTSGRKEGAGTGPDSGELGPEFDTANIQDVDFEGSGEVLGSEECSAADLAVEEQIEALFFTENPQALRRVSDFAHSRQAASGGSVQNLNEAS